MRLKDGNYVTIQAFMINDLKLSGNELIIYAVIYGLTQDGSWFYGSSEYLAAWCGASRNTVFSNLKKLVDEGFLLKRTQNTDKGKMCEYRPCYVPSTSDNAVPCEPTASSDPTQETCQPLPRNLVTPTQETCQPLPRNLVTPTQETCPNKLEEDNLVENQVRNSSSSARAARAREEGLDSDGQDPSPDASGSQTEGRRGESQSRKGNPIPTVEEVEGFCEAGHLNVDPREFHDSCERRGWKAPDGSPIRDWKGYLMGWEKNGGRAFPGGTGGRRPADLRGSLPMHGHGDGGSDEPRRRKTVEEVMASARCSREMAEAIIEEGADWMV